MTYGLRVPSTLPPDAEELVAATIGCCLAVHRELGPELLESVYPRAVGYQLECRGIPFELERPLPIRYGGKILCHHRIDIFVDQRLVLEAKSVERIHPIHVAQVISYLRLTGHALGS